MNLTLTREQIPLARETVAFLRSFGGGPAADQPFERRRVCPGWDWWTSTNADDGEWADALEAAITEAEGTQVLVKVASEDERRLWLNTVAAYVSQGQLASSACDEADEALARYRKAFGGES